MTPLEASNIVNEKVVFTNFEDKKKHKPFIKLGQLVRTADIKKTFSKTDSTNWSIKLYKKTQTVRDIVPSYRINFISETYH